MGGCASKPETPALPQELGKDEVLFALEISLLRQLPDGGPA